MKAGGDVAREQRREASSDAVDELGSGFVGELVIEQVTSREAADRWHQIAQECFEEDYYEMPAQPVQEVYERLESTRTDEQYELWLGCLGTEAGGSGMPVVLGELGLPMLDNTDNGVVTVSTRPTFRERGYGTAMLRHITARARLHGRTRLIGEIGEPLPLDESSSIPDTVSSSSRFATHAGARAVTSEVRRLLRIEELDHVELKRLKEDATAHSTGYSLIQWEGPAPEEIVGDLAVLHSRMSIDAPLEDLDWEPEQWSAERYREREQRVATSGQVCLSTVARHDQSGQIVALTEIGLEAAPPDIAYQWLTIVLPTHRGHRLGMLVKVANLEFLQTNRPLVQVLNTWNAAINDHMVGINEAIGFRPVERWREWQLELPSPAT
jgi:GNAT superfamily N-acetyltransferase